MSGTGRETEYLEECSKIQLFLYLRQIFFTTVTLNLEYTLKSPENL